MPRPDASPHLVDAHVGSRIRELRKTQGVTQEALAERLGVASQQVQKYEKGANRVSASKLYEIAGVLEVGVEAFFRGLAHEPADRGEPTHEVDELLARMPRQRRRLALEMMRTLANTPAT